MAKKHPKKSKPTTLPRDHISPRHPLALSRVLFSHSDETKSNFAKKKNMNENPNNQNPLNNNEEHEKLVLGLKEDIQEALTEKEKWKGSYVKSEQSVAELEREKRQLEEDKADLKRQIMAQRRIELDQKETKQSNEFLANLTQKLDAKIGGAK